MANDNKNETPINADISPAMHPLSIEPMKDVLGMVPATARAFAAGQAALKNLYDGMADLENVNTLVRAKPSGRHSRRWCYRPHYA